MLFTVLDVVDLNDFADAKVSFYLLGK